MDALTAEVSGHTVEMENIKRTQVEDKERFEERFAELEQKVQQLSEVGPAMASFSTGNFLRDNTCRRSLRLYPVSMVMDEDTDLRYTQIRAAVYAFMRDHL